MFRGDAPLVKQIQGAVEHARQRLKEVAARKHELLVRAFLTTTEGLEAIENFPTVEELLPTPAEIEEAE